MRIKTIKDVLKHCEQRAGVRFVGGNFIPIGGGLYALEQIAPEEGAFPKMYYTRQRIELENLMYAIISGETL